VSPAGGGGESATRDRAVAAEDAPDPAADELVARAAAMRDTLRARQAECEALGRLPDATNAEYIEAGFFRVLPRRFGGHELGLEAFLRIAIELSRGCPSSGWVYALTAGHAHTVTMWPEYGIVDNWDTLGMRGTGSRRVVVEDLLVPEHHTVPSPNPGRPVVDFPGRGVHANAIYRGGSIIPLLVSEPAAVAVGIAQGAIDHYIEILQTRHQQAHDVVERGIAITDEMQRRLLMICQQNVELCPRTECAI
jgi:alkylation response protein AidB-like acyl-CoA dehydrogenase